MNLPKDNKENKMIKNKLELPTLRLYEDENGQEVIVICNNLEETNDLMQEAKLLYEFEINGDVIALPTDRPLRDVGH